MDGLARIVETVEEVGLTPGLFGFGFTEVTVPRGRKIEQIFWPLQSQADKLKNTTDAAHAINEEEAVARECKIARLREARLAKEAEEPEKPAAKSRTARKGN